MYTYYNIMCAFHEDTGDDSFKNIFPYHLLRVSWYHYLSLLDIDYPEGFTCHKCSVSPRIVICDATSLAFRRQLLQAGDVE